MSGMVANQKTWEQFMVAWEVSPMISSLPVVVSMVLTMA